MPASPSMKTFFFKLAAIASTRMTRDLVDGGVLLRDSSRARDAPRTEDALRANADMTNSRVSIDGCRSV